MGLPTPVLIIYYRINHAETTRKVSVGAYLSMGRSAKVQDCVSGIILHVGK